MKAETQSKVKYTPGPWRCGLKVLTNENGAEFTRPGYRFVEAGVGFGNTYNTEQSEGFGITAYMKESDAKLIAAAPDLLDTLRVIAEENYDDDDKRVHLCSRIDSMKKFARQAIKKATGE